MRTVVYYVSSSLDGFIARADHSVDGFITEGAMVQDYLDSLHNDFDTVVMGRKTYEFGLQFGVDNPYPWLKQYVISSSMSAAPHPEIELAQGDGTTLVRTLKAQPGGMIYLCGGGKLAGALLEAGLIDEVVIKLNPLVLGSGVPLFGGVADAERLSLIECQPFPEGGVRLRYQVHTER